MEIGSVVDVWDDIETEAESEGSYVCKDEVVEEFEGDSSDNDTNPVPSTSATNSSARSRGCQVEYNWQE